MRQWLSDSLTSPGVTALVDTRIFQASDLLEVPEKPFLSYSFGVRMDARVASASRWPFQVWVHDDVGSYLRIDRILDEVKAALLNADRPGELLEVHWLEDSGDLRDDEMRTVTRYSRFQLALSRRGGE